MQVLMSYHQLIIVLITIHKPLISPQLDFDSINCDQASKTWFRQYNSHVGISEAIWTTSKEKPYHELGFEPPNFLHWYQKLRCLYKILKKKKTFQSILWENIIILSLKQDQILLFNVRYNFFKYNLFFVYIYWMEWLRLLSRILKVTVVFLKNILKFLISSLDSVYVMMIKT